MNITPVYFNHYIKELIKCEIKAKNVITEALGVITSICISRENKIYYFVEITSIVNPKGIIWPSRVILDKNLNFVTFDARDVFN